MKMPTSVEQGAGEVRSFARTARPASSSQKGTAPWVLEDNEVTKEDHAACCQALQFLLRKMHQNYPTIPALCRKPAPSEPFLRAAC